LFGLFTMASSKVDPSLLAEVPPPRDTAFVAADGSPGAELPFAPLSPRDSTLSPPAQQPLSPTMTVGADPPQRFVAIRMNVADGFDTAARASSPSPPPQPPPVLPPQPKPQPATLGSAAVVHNRLYRVLRQSHEMSAGIMRVVHGSESAPPTAGPSILAGAPCLCPAQVAEF
jgi:hypothetical protein